MTTPDSPVSYPVTITRLPAKGLPVRFEADEAMREALAQAHGLVSVERFVVDVLVENWKGSGVSVKGTVQADVTQSCIVTLDPLPARIDAEIKSIFLPNNSKLARFQEPNGEIVIDPYGDDVPEVFDGDKIDVGAHAEEYFAIMLDPYPRKPGVDPVEILEGEEAPVNPLAEKLAALKGKL